MNHDTIDHDRPCVSSDVDEFGRKPFAERLANLISKETTSEHLVISLYGAWGEGKTSTLNYTVDYLRQIGLPCLEFNPWRYPEEEALLVALFHSLAKTIDRDIKTKREKIADLVEKNFPWSGESISLIPRFGGAAKAVWNGTLAKLRPRIESVRARIKEELRQIKDRVIIVLDDADRLEGDDLLALFRLIKLTADFPNTTCLIAIDDVSVARSIGNKVGGGELAGRAYLEKIVQVPLRLPIISPLQLRDYTLVLIDRVLKNAGRELNHEQVSRFRRIFDGLFAPCIATPRQAKTFTNCVRFGISLLRDELDLADQLLLECARVILPKLYTELHQNHTLLVPDWEDAMIWRLDETAEPSRLDKFLQKIPAETHPLPTRMSEALCLWFPQLIGKEDEDKNNANQRLCSKKYFWRYFSLHISHSDYPDSKINRLVDALNENSEETIPEIVLAALKADFILPSCESMLEKLRHAISRLQNRAALQLARAISESSDQIPAESGVYAAEGLVGYSASVACGCLYSGASTLTQRQSEILEEMILGSPSLVWAYCLVRALPETDSAWKVSEEGLNGGVTTQGTFRPLSKLATRLENAVFAADSSVPLEHFVLYLGIIYRWGDRPKLLAFVEDKLNTEPDFITWILAASCSRSLTSEEKTYSWRGTPITLVERYASESVISKALRRLELQPPNPNRDFHEGFDLAELAQAYLDLRSLSKQE